VPYPSLIVPALAVLYTWLAFWAPLGDDFPSLWSNNDAALRWKIIFVHTLFLAAYLGVFAWLTWRESSIGWLTRGYARQTGGACLIIVGVFTAIIERLLFSRGPKPVNEDDGQQNQKL
jgi:hypothetical protein